MVMTVFLLLSDYPRDRLPIWPWPVGQPPRRCVPKSRFYVRVVKCAWAWLVPSECAGCDCHGIIRVGCSPQTWPSVASVRQKDSNCQIFLRKRTALQLRVLGDNYSPLCELVSSLSGSEILIPSRSCSRPAFRARSTAKSSYRSLRTGSFVARASDMQTWA